MSGHSRFVMPLFLGLLQACGADPAGPGQAVTGPLPVAGQYVATTLVTARGGTEADQLAAGVRMTLTLLPDGHTAGAIFVPSIGVGAPAITFDLAGTWALDSTTLELAHQPETFLAWIPFRATVHHLRGEVWFGDTVVRVVLTKIDPATGEPFP